MTSAPSPEALHELAARNPGHLLRRTVILAPQSSKVPNGHQRGGLFRTQCWTVRPIPREELEPLVNALLRRVSQATGMTVSEVSLGEGEFTLTAPAQFLAVLADQPEILDVIAAPPQRIGVGLG